MPFGHCRAAGGKRMNDRTYYKAFERPREELMLLQRVCYLLFTSLAVTALTAYVSRDVSPGLALPLFIGMLVCIFALRAAARVPVLNLVLFYLFSALEGLMAGPVLAAVTRYVPNGAGMISLSFCLTAATVGGVGTYVWCTARDYSYLGRTLFIALWVVIGVNLVMWFVPGLRSEPLQLLYSGGIVVLFTGFLFYDFSNIRLRFGLDDYVIASIELYLDFINLFWAILRILMILSGNGRRR
jgi:FtsH-binding integral membrane protein